MTASDPLVSTLQEGRRRFLELVADIRPDLHRYSARMTGSVADGEDIVQDTLARAYYALSELSELPPLRPWLFQIAHNRALDHLRRYDRRMGQALEGVAETLADGSGDPETALAREEATRFAIARFSELVPLQRSAVILKDVLGHSNEEIAELIGLSVPAVKAALHRGRERLRSLAKDPPPEPLAAPRAASAGLARYTELFNARDWDGVRALLAEDVRLDLVARVQRTGRRDVASYFSNYSRVPSWYLRPAFVDGREAIAVFLKPESPQPDYFVELTLSETGIKQIKDFRYVPYILADAAVVIAAPASEP
jgi:RNA polymerase sigma factor (sigma-70 family)